MKNVCKKGKGHSHEKLTKHCVGARILRFSHCNICRKTSKNYQKLFNKCRKIHVFWDIDFESILTTLWIFDFSDFLGSRFSELFLKKSIPHGSSGQTAMCKMIPYESSSFQGFVKKCRKYVFLPIRFHFFMITLFPPFVRLKPVQAGFCVSIQTLICLFI